MVRIVRIVKRASFKVVCPKYVLCDHKCCAIKRGGGDEEVRRMSVTACMHMSLCNRYIKRQGVREGHTSEDKGGFMFM